ncbi:MAG: V-type ATP synthase subunit E [Bacillota bacterium]
MPVTIEDKIEMFRKMLFGNVELNSSQRKKSLMDELEEKKKKLEAEIEEKRQCMFCEAENQAEKERKQLVSKAQSDEHYRILKKQQEYIEILIDILKKKAEVFAATTEYCDSYIRKNLEAACSSFLDSDEVYFYFTEADLSKNREFICSQLDSLRRDKAYKIEKADKNILGGFLVLDREKACQADYTLLALIEENRDIIGLSISQLFDEVMH